ncbi:MAG: GAF domain-containing protein [Chloroflexota bacterium]
MIQASSGPEVFTDDWRIQPGHGLIGTAVASQQTIISNNTSEDARFVAKDNPLEKQHPRRNGPALIVDGEVVGVLDVQSPKAGIFTRIEKMTLEALASEIAISISKLRQSPGSVSRRGSPPPSRKWPKPSAAAPIWKIFSPR